MTLGRDSVGYLTESLHGTGSPQAQRIQSQHHVRIAFKQQSAKRLAGINLPDDVMDGLGEVLEGYFARVFATT